MSDIKYDNTKLCRRNYRFNDYLAEACGIPSFFINIVGLLILFWLGITEKPMIYIEITSVLLICCIITFLVSMVYVNTKHIDHIDGIIYYKDEYSKVIKTVKIPKSK